jgi:hypothetical protein
MAEGNIIAPIITAHISQTATTSLTAQSDVIGIIRLTRGEDMLAADQRTRPQPVIDRTTSAAKPFRMSAPFAGLDLIAICAGSVPVGEIGREPAALRIAECQWGIFDCQARDGFLTRVIVPRNAAGYPSIKFKVTHDLRRC